MTHDAAVGRAEALYQTHAGRIYARTSRMFAGLLAVEWIVGVAVALALSPSAWVGTTSRTHPHVWMAVFVGGLLALPPVVMARRQPDGALTRHMIAVAQMLFGAMFIHLSEGRIETHFHIFGSLAFLAFYRDYRVLLTATAVVVLDHLSRGMLAPMSIYGVEHASMLRTLEHAGWVVFEDIFLFRACFQSVKEMREIARQRADSEAQHEVELGAARAHEASRAKSEFLANMSHEIRTPMTAVQGYADLLLDPELCVSDRLNYVQTIRRNSEHLLSIINDILDISKIEAGKMTVEQVDTSPAQVVVDVTSLMRVRATDKGLGFETRFLTPIPRTFKCDPVRLRQILMNLVGNAIKFTAAGSVEMRVRCSRPDGESPSLTFEIADTGIGMTPEQMTRIFNSFEQADASMTRRFGGSGLGLAISKRLARMLGGDIDVRSTPDAGTTFSVTVPTGSLRGASMIADLREAGPQETASAPALGRMNGKWRILLAEDGIDNQRLVTLYLTKAGAEVTLAENGRIALDKALAAFKAGNPYDLILMDMQMPELDGYGATSSLRSRGYDRPIVALTAHAMAGDRERCLQSGCSEFLTKPVDRAALIDMCNAQIEQHRERPATPRKRSVSRASSGSMHIDVLVSNMIDDPDMTEIIDLFVASLPERVTRMTKAFEGDDLTALKRDAHQLKGAAGGYGFPTITVAASALERWVADAKPREDVERLLGELGALCLRARGSAQVQRISLKASQGEMTP